MAKIKNGILGPVSGKVGSVVACNGKQGNHVRAYPKKSNKPPSEKQKAQRKKFGLVQKFLTPMRDLLTFSFASEFISMGASKLASSYNLKNAVRGVYPNYYIDYSLVWMSFGYLPAAVSTAVNSVEAGKLLFTWTDNSGQGKASPGDRTILVAYYSENGSCRTLIQGAERQAGTDVLDVTGWSGRKVHCWLGFVSKDGKDKSPGMYVGEVVVK